MYTIPREPSISFWRAAAEYGSVRSMSDASISNTDASSTRVRAGGMSCFKIGSSLLLIVSYPTYTDVAAVKLTFKQNFKSSVNVHCKPEINDPTTYQYCTNISPHAELQQARGDLFMWRFIKQFPVIQ